MRRPRAFAFVFLFGLSACSGPPGSADDSPALLNVWVGLTDAAESLAASEANPCDPDFGTWFADFGVRGLACVAADVMAPTRLIAQAGGNAFETGPHRATSESFSLDLTSQRDFGRYNPDFVEWVIENGVVGEGRPALRALTTPIYRVHLMRLTRIYWLTYEDMAADGFPRRTPAGILSDYAAFLDGGPIPEEAEGYEGGFSVFAFTELSEGILPRTGLRFDNDWTAKYEANTAFGFWLRRRADGTLALWRDGLERLLETYDEEWLAERR